MSAATTGARGQMSLQDWALLPEEATGELIDGVLVEEEMPSFVHEVVVSWLNAFLRLWASPRSAIVAGSGLKLRVSASRGRMADLVVYFQRGKVEPRGLVTVAPDIAVEVVSPDPRDQKRDRVDKHAEYAAFGVRWYWLVSPELRVIEILELGTDGRYVHAQNLTGGACSVAGCDGLTLDLDDLWREVERAEREED